MRLLLIGSGGHARIVQLMLDAAGHTLDGYVDPRPNREMAARWFADDAQAIAEAPGAGIAMGLGGAEPRALARRLALYRRYIAAGRPAPALVHRTAVVCTTARVGDGTLILAGAIVQPAARLGAAVIVNSGAIVEHDSIVGDGAHIAPGAILLGTVRVGEAAMIGAGAVILPGAEVPAGTLVPALTRYPKPKS